MKLNLKKLCPLLILYIATLATMAPVFATNEKPGGQSTEPQSNSSSYNDTSKNSSKKQRRSLPMRKMKG